MVPSLPDAWNSRVRSIRVPRGFPLVTLVHASPESLLGTTRDRASTDPKGAAVWRPSGAHPPPHASWPDGPREVVFERPPCPAGNRTQILAGVGDHRTDQRLPVLRDGTAPSPAPADPTPYTLADATAGSWAGRYGDVATIFTFPDLA